MDGTHVIYVLQFKPEVYDELPVNPKVPLSVIVWKDLFKPLSLLAAGGVLGGAFFHYMIHGPKTPHEEVNDDAGKTEGRRITMKKGYVQVTDSYERILHWMLAISCLLLCVTGLGMMFQTFNFFGAAIRRIEEPETGP